MAVDIQKLMGNPTDGGVFYVVKTFYYYRSVSAGVEGFQIWMVIRLVHESVYLNNNINTMQINAQTII